jgi:hypothetical protein
MSTAIKLKRSGVAGEAPASLEYGEVALNYADGILYYKNGAGEIVALSTGEGGGGTIGNTFSRVAVSGQSTIVADSSTDTLTVEGAGLVSVSTNASTDTLTVGLASSIPFFKQDGSQVGVALQSEAGPLSTLTSLIYLPFRLSDGTDVTTLRISV